MNDYEITLYSKIGDTEHVMGPFRRRARSTGAAIAAEMRQGQWDADVVQVRAELVSRLTPQQADAKARAERGGESN